MSLPSLIPRALLFGDPEIRFPRISPDGPAHPGEEIEPFLR